MSFVKFKLSDIRQSVRIKLDDLAFDSSVIDECANDFQFELFNDNRFRFMEKNEILSPNVGGTSVALPNDFMNIINLTAIDSTTEFRDITSDGYLDYTTFMKRYPNFSVNTASKILDWTFYGEGLRFQSPTDGTYTLSLDYLRSPALMVDATDECELPINARELMTLGTLERVQRINEDYSQSDFEKNRLDGLRTAFIRNYGRGGAKVGPQLMRSNRYGRGSSFDVSRDF